MKTSTSARTGLLQKIESGALFAALLVVPIAFANGFSRQEVVKDAFLVLLGGVVSAVWLLDFCRGRQTRVLHGGLLAGLALVFILLGAASAMWAPEGNVAFRELARWIVLTGIFVAAASTARPRVTVALPLLIAGGLTALVVLLAHFGLELVPRSPTGVAPDAGRAAFFDHELFAASFLAVVAPLGLYLAGAWPSREGAAGVRALRIVFVGVAALAYLAVGLVGGPVAAIALGALVLGVLVGAGRLSRSPRAPLLWVGALIALLAGLVGLFALGEPATPASVEAEASSPLDELGHREVIAGVYDRNRVPDWDNAVTTLEEWSFEWGRSLGLLEKQPLRGHGLGSWKTLIGAGVDTEHPYYTHQRDPYHLHQTPPGFLVGIAVELGGAGLVIWLAFLVGALWVAVRGLRRGGDDDGATAGDGFLLGAAAAAVLLGLFTQAAGHAGEGVALLAVLGLATQMDPVGSTGLFRSRRIEPAQGAFGRFERWVLVGVPALALLAPAAWMVGRSTLGEYYRHRGEVFFQARMAEEAIESFRDAVSAWPKDALSHYYLGVALYFTPQDRERADEADEMLTEAARLAPNDVRIAVKAIRVHYRTARLGLEERLDAAVESRDELDRLVALDPRYVETRQQLAESLEVLGDYEEALGALRAVTEMSQEPHTLASAHYRMGEIYRQQLSEPEQALEQYRQAASLLQPGASLLQDIQEQMAFVERWIETGQEPREGFGNEPQHEH